jgi:hypothetical protein
MNGFQIAIKEWKKFFFNENEQPDFCVPLAICKLLEEEFTGTSCFIEVATTLLTSYSKLHKKILNYTNEAKDCSFCDFYINLGAKFF